ncbi:MAG: PhzF family phenazine biosynthesis protein [Pseudomonadota bacterium]
MGKNHRMKMFQVDAFADRVFAGNPAAVLVLDEWMEDALMLSIAQENNLAETAFVVPREGGGWRLRWFAPAHEVDFCGHATIATAHVLATEYHVDGEMIFDTRVGELRVLREGNAYQLDIPRLDPQPLSKLPLELDGVFADPPIFLFRNFENIFADLGCEAAVRKFIPDLTRIARLGPVGLVVTGQGNGNSGAAFVSRYFAPGAGIPEDPVTGSIHATLVPYWSELLGDRRHRAYQASGRGGWLDCELTADRVFLRGGAITFMEADVILAF